MVKSTHPGAAARQGVEAALLAQAGFLSHDSIIEARQGMSMSSLRCRVDRDT
jgi:2-methylcitrate dehydratase PrpD